MSLVVTCACGQRFAAEDRLIGQKVPCPVCGSPLTIGLSPVAAQPVVTQGVRVTCGCGRAFLAPEQLRGQTAQCPACGGAILVPGADPLDLGSGQTSDIGGLNSSPLYLPTQRPSDDTEIPWQTLGYLAAGGVVLLVIVITITSIRSYLHDRRAVDQPPPVAAAPAPALPPKPAPQPAPAPQQQRAPAAAPAPPPPTPTPRPAAPVGPVPPVADSAATNDSASARANVASSAADRNIPAVTVLAGSASPDGAAVARLPEGVQAWYEQPGMRLSGIRRVGASDSPTGNFSWMTGLLPFLGYGQVYGQIDFSQSLTKNSNLQVGGTIIPEFLNPLDDRQRWKGYPFNNMALTHFAGMSGVEDARNVVAAKLPRSDSRAGVFGYDEVARPADITDGTSQTLMIVGTGELPNPWIFGGGATIRGAR